MKNAIKSAVMKGSLTAHCLPLSHLRSLFYRISVSARSNVTTFGFDLVSNTLNHLWVYSCAAYFGKNGIRTFPVEHQRIPRPVCFTYQPGSATAARTGTGSMSIPEITNSDTFISAACVTCLPRPTHHRSRPYHITHHSSVGTTIMMKRANRYHRQSIAWSHIAYQSMNCSITRQ